MSYLLFRYPTGLQPFTFHNIPSPLDLSFQKISGLNRTLPPLSQGGKNGRNYHLADKVEHGTLVLE